MLTTPTPSAAPALVQPLWQCGMRPFFVATAAAAVLLMALWLAFLGAGWPLPPAVGGPFAWHAHELLYGFALASVLGFLLTAVPEFTATADFSSRVARLLLLLWLAGRVAFWLGGWGGAAMIAVSGLLHLALIGALAVLAAPRLWADPQRQHMSFLWALLALGVCEAGFHAELLVGSASPLRWLHASVGVYMVLIVVALSRISMRIVNQALLDAGLAAGYLARPPRRNLLIVCITLYTAAELLWPGSRLAGWLALAAGAAVFHLMNDWHVGRVLLTRWPLMLYAIYVCMGLGYVAMGLGVLTPLGSFSGGRHLLTVGALGLAILGAMSIAGRAHCGRPPETRVWLPLAAACLFAAAIVRALAGWWLADVMGAWLLAGALWCGVFALYLYYLAPVLLGGRNDGGHGCQGVQQAQQAQQARSGA